MPKIQIADKPTLDKIYAAVANTETEFFHAARSTKNKLVGNGESFKTTVLDLVGRGKLYHALAKYSSYANNVMRLTVTLDGQIIYDAYGVQDSAMSASGSGLLGIRCLKPIAGRGEGACLPLIDFAIPNPESDVITSEPVSFSEQLQVFEFVHASGSSHFFTVNIAEPLEIRESLKVEAYYECPTTSTQINCSSFPVYVLYSLTE